jgi:hypothetical protein
MGRSLTLALALASGIAAQEPTFKTGISPSKSMRKSFDEAALLFQLRIKSKSVDSNLSLTINDLELAARWC